MHLVKTATTLAGILVVATIHGCGGPAPDQPAPRAANEASETGEQSAPAAAGADELDLGGAAVTPPADWRFRQPSSSMRLAEAEIPGPTDPALLTVFFFGPGGGGRVQANLERWLGQIEADPANPPQRERFSVGDFTVSTVTATGTLLPSRMGTGPTEAQPDSMLAGAVVEGPGGPWFFKLTGPQETVAQATGDFDRMLRSVRASG